MKIVDLAIIIPALNEKHFIGKLLDSIISQTVHPKELVVVDACSKDKTIREIQKRQKKLPDLRVFKIPKFTISRQRNFGVRKTRSSHILFLDADMMLKEKDILEKFFNEILQKKPDIAAATTLPDSKLWKDIIYFKFEDWFIELSRYFWPGFTGRNLYVKRKIFERVGGFDEEVAIAEDYELVGRIVKQKGKLEFIKSVKLHTSTRRLQHEGRRKFVLKVFLFGIKILLFGYKKARIKYEFGRFDRPQERN